MSDKSDRNLWIKIQDDDENSFSELFHIYYEALYQFAGRFLFDVQFAENIVQDVFVNIWENRKRININTSLKSYLYTSTKNHCLNYIKQNKKNFQQIKSVFNQQDNCQSPEADYIDNELNNFIFDAINHLPDKCRQIYLLKRYDGLKYKEISGILNISENTVKTQMKRAIKFLIEKISPLLQLF